MTSRLQLSLAAGAVALLAIAAAPLIANGMQDAPQGGALGRPGPGPRGGPFGRGPMGRGPGGPMGLLGDLGPALRQAGVTEDQQQQIKQVMDSHRDEFQAIGERMKTAREGLRGAIEADTVDENAIRAKSQDVAAVEADQSILGAKVRAEILGLLTAEQLDKVKAFRAEMQKRRSERPRGQRPRA